MCCLLFLVAERMDEHGVFMVGSQKFHSMGSALLMVSGVKFAGWSVADTPMA